MWFKNLQIYRLPAPWTITAEQLAGHIAPQAFAACSSLEMQSQGWVSPLGNERLVHTVNRQFLLKLDTEKKLLPSSVINQVAKARAAELEEQQGFPPGRKQTKELKEQVADELLPRAFSIVRSTWTWIDPVNGWLIVDAGSPGKAEEVLKLLLKAIPKFPLETLRTVRSPLSSMTDWLASDEAPSGFTVDQDTELRASGDSKATVRFVRHTLEPDDVRRHIEAGKQTTRLALTWNDRVSFVLTENLSLKKLAPLDVLKEDSDLTGKNDIERMDGDFMLMAGELNNLLNDLVAALGGRLIERSLVEPASDSTVPTNPPAATDDGDELYDQAELLVRTQNRASISLIQRHLRIGYNRAARLLEAMEVKQIVGPMQRDGSRKIKGAA
jgi:recombination associated protein RdgC